MAYKQVFFDPSAPDAGQTGTYAHPYTQQSMLTYANLGDECDIFSPRGLLYTNPNSAGAIFYALNWTPAGRIRWMPYDTGPEMPPTAFGGYPMVAGDVGWVYMGDGIWKKSLLFNSASASLFPEHMRLFAGARITGPAQNKSPGTGWIQGTPIAKAAVTTKATDTTEADILTALHHTTHYGYFRDWHLSYDDTTSTAVLYVYTGSATQDPPTFYDGIILTGSNGLTGGTGWGRVTGMKTLGSYNVQFIGLDVTYTASGIALATAAADGTQWQNNQAIGCRAWNYSLNGINIYGANVNRRAQNYAAIDCECHQGWQISEEWNYRDKAGVPKVEWINAKLDTAIIGAFTTDCSMDNVRLYLGGAHSSFYIGVGNSAIAGYTVNARVTNCKVYGDPANTYNYFIASAGLGVGNVARIDRFYGEHCCNFIHKTGSGQLHITDSVMCNATQPFLGYGNNKGSTGGEMDGTETNWEPAIDVYKNAPFGAIEENALVLRRSTFAQSYGPMISLYSYGDVTGTVLPPGTIKAYDSVFIDTANLNNVKARCFNNDTLLRPGMSIEARDWGTAVGCVQFSNVFYWTGSGPGQQRVAQVTSANPPLTTLAAWPGLTGTFSEVDPMADSSFFLKNGSPAIGLATVSEPSRDARGVWRKAQSACGGYEYVGLRRKRALPPVD